MAAWHRHRRRVFANGLTTGPVSSAIAVNKGRTVVERAGAPFFELIPRPTSQVAVATAARRNVKARSMFVGEREPQQHGAGLVFAAHQQPGQSHAARPGIGAFGLRALFVERLAHLAGHALAPIRHPRFVVAPRA